MRYQDTNEKGNSPTVSRVQNTSKEQAELRRRAEVRRKRKKKRVLVFRIKVCIGAFLILFLWELGKKTTDFLVNLLPDKEVSQEVIQLDSLIEEEIPEDRVSFLAVGDNIGHDRVHAYGDLMEGDEGDGKYDFKPSYKNVYEQITNVDLAFINQESIIGGVELGITGYPAFNSPEDLAKNIVEVGFDIVNAATNHILDKGDKGVANAAETWGEFQDVLYVGAYESQESADTIRTIERNGIVFSVLAYTYGTNGYTSNYNYTAPIFDEAKIIKDVALAKEISDVVIVSAHWGTEGSFELDDTQKKYSQLFADEGVDLVIGHHAHVIQELNWLEGKNGNKTLVAYGLGNFLSTMESVDNQLEGMLTLDFVRVEENVVIENVQFIPLINHFGEGPVEVHYLKDYTEELGSVHYTLKTQNIDYLAYYWSKVDEIIPEEFRAER